MGVLARGVPGPEIRPDLGRGDTVGGYEEVDSLDFFLEEEEEGVEKGKGPKRDGFLGGESSPEARLAIEGWNFQGSSRAPSSQLLFFLSSKTRTAALLRRAYGVCLALMQ